MKSGGRSRARRARRRASLTVATVVASLALLLSPAYADVTPEGECDGFATIQGEKYTPENDTSGNPIIVPKDEGVVIPWEGWTTFDNNGHEGQLAVKVGPIDVQVADWKDREPDEPNKERTGGNYSLDDFYDNKSPFGRNVIGLYQLTGSHAANGGSCSGNAMVKFEGSVLSSPLGSGSILLIIITAGGVAMASIARKEREGEV